MLFTFLIASLFNLFTLELLVNQRLDHINQLLGDDMDSLIAAYDYVGNTIPWTTTKCYNKSDCLQIMCRMNQISDCAYIKLWSSVSWANKCNLNVTDSIHKLFKEWRSTCLTVLVSNGLILIVLFIVWIARLYNRVSWHIMCLFTFPLFLLSIESIVVLSIQLIDSSSEIIAGANYFNRIHNIIVLCVYVLFMFLFLIKIVWSLLLEHNKPKEIEYNNLS
jgi:hypothetical protein